MRVSLWPDSSPSRWVFPKRHRSRVGIALDILGHEVVKDSADVTLYWNYDARGPEAPEGVVNRACYDVTKTRVQAVHEAAFGHSARVCPHSHTGPLYEKPNGQSVKRLGRKLGRVVSGCQEPRDGFVYERLLASPSRPCAEYRVLVARTDEGLTAPLVLSRKRDRPGGDLLASVELGPERLQTVPEARAAASHAVTFSQAFGLDFAELDVMFGPDERPHVLDVNATPGELPERRTWGRDRYRRHLRAFARALDGTLKMAAGRYPSFEEAYGTPAYEYGDHLSFPGERLVGFVLGRVLRCGHQGIPSHLVYPAQT